MKKFLCMALGAVVGMVGLSSCNNERVSEVKAPADEVYVSVETYVQDGDGVLTPISLRAVTGDTNKATVTGDGKYHYNDLVNLKVTAKSPYTLYQLYEKSEKGGFTKANGKVDGAEKTLSFNVTEDMTFVAIFTNVNEEEKGYRNLKVDGKTSDFALSLETTEQNYTSNVTTDMLAVGEEVAAVKTPSGEVVSFNVLNPDFKAWDVVGPTSAADWATVSIDKATGKVSVVTKPYTAKAPARSTKIRIGKDGSNATMPKAWIEVTINQSSFYKGTDEVDPNNPSLIDANGGKVDLKPNLDATFPPEGGTIDFGTLDPSLKSPIYVKVPTYKDGQLLPEDQWVKEKVTIEFGDPTQPWIKKDGSKYTVPVNNGKTPRTDTITVTLKVGDKVVGTTKVKVSQEPKKYKIDVEIQ